VQGRAPTGSSQRCISNSRAAAEGGVGRPGDRHALDEAEVVLSALKLCSGSLGLGTEVRAPMRSSHTRTRVYAATRASPGRGGVRRPNSPVLLFSRAAYEEAWLWLRRCC
jgi:hypothetical protein